MNTSENWIDSIEKAIDFAEEYSKLYKDVASLVNRDIKVLQSFLSQVKSRGTLSPGQKAYFYAIGGRYSDVEQEKAWIQDYSKEHREIALRVARYYKSTVYFANLTSRVLADPETYVVPKRFWSKYCENKYAKKILNQYDQEIKFSKGDSIQIRSKNRLDRANYGGNFRSLNNACSNKPGVVLEVDCKPITEGFKGSRVYKVLIHGQSKPIFAFESDLKKARYKRK